MAESADLDWKAGLPPAQADEALTEFAKDVAAMANSGGGLLVYGIKETRGTGEATAIKSVDGSDQTQRRLRQALNARIRPLVSGLDMIPLTSPDGKSTVLALAVPRSPDVPHFVGDRNSMGVPYRMGAQTEWMSETQIARAYADRFSLHESEQARLGRMVAEAGARLDLSQGTWLVAVARPAVPAPTVRRPLPRTEIRPLLEDGRPRRPCGVDTSPSVGGELHDDAADGGDVGRRRQGPRGSRRCVGPCRGRHGRAARTGGRPVAQL